MRTTPLRFRHITRVIRQLPVEMLERVENWTQRMDHLRRSNGQHLIDIGPFSQCVDKLPVTKCRHKFIRLIICPLTPTKTLFSFGNTSQNLCENWELCLQVTSC